MYEAPDRYKRMVSARLPGGESLALTTGAQDDSSSPLRDVQLISRAQLAPFFAAANVVAAVLLVAALWNHAAPQWLLGRQASAELGNYQPKQLARKHEL